VDSRIPTSGTVDLDVQRPRRHCSRDLGRRGWPVGLGPAGAFGSRDASWWPSGRSRLERVFDPLLSWPATTRSRGAPGLRGVPESLRERDKLASSCLTRRRRSRCASRFERAEPAASRQWPPCESVRSPAEGRWRNDDDHRNRAEVATDRCLSTRWQSSQPDRARSRRSWPHTLDKRYIGARLRDKGMGKMRREGEKTA
jgi:hypothetical protein